MEMRAYPFSPYMMLVHLYDSHLLPSTATTWKLRSQGLAHLSHLRVIQINRLYFLCLCIIVTHWITNKVFVLIIVFVLELCCENS